VQVLNRRISKYFFIGPAAAFFVFSVCTASLLAADNADQQQIVQQETVAAVEQNEPADDQFEDAWAEEENWGVDADGSQTIADPFEPVNRVFFHFNDKLYYWVLKPVARGYKAILPEDVRIVVRNFFNNLLAPRSIANNLLQGKDL